MTKRLFKNSFISATFWMFVATGFLNGGNYLYHLLMGRLLGRTSYGVLESVIGLLYILAVPLMTLTLVIVKFVSTYKGKGELTKISGLISFLNRRLLIFGIFFSLLMFALTPLIADFLHLPSVWIVFLLITSFFIGLFNMTAKAVLQGLTNFFALAITNILEITAKVAVAVVLVLVGLRVEGAFLGIVSGTLIGFFAAWWFLRSFIKLNKAINSFKEQKRLLSFSFPVFFNNLAFTSLFTTDILLVRHFFTGVESGEYAALSVLGKIIFFAASPISLVMFPFVSEHHASKKDYNHLFIISLALTIVIVVFITLIYFLSPNTMVNLLFGKEFNAITSLLGFFGIFLGLYTLCYLLANFYLSIHKTKIISLVVLAALSQIIIIWFFHITLFEVIKVSIMVTFLLLVSLMLYYPYAKRS